MSMVEVDPNLFIKCRLCLMECGTYQIVPMVRDQINYCFQINVEPFDGMPQLICKKCQTILCEYSNTKRSFIEKQDELKKLTQENNLLQEIKQNNCEPAVEDENVSYVSKNKNKRRKLSESSISSNESHHNGESINEPMIDDSNVAVETKTQDWTREYRKTFACNMCYSTWFTQRSAVHHWFKHKVLMSKHADVFSKYCVVELPRVDNKPNLTGSFDKVVYSKRKIIEKCTTNFCVVYKYKGQDSSDREIVKRNESCNVDSSPSDNDIKIKSRKRIRRLSSRSSTETVVLENKSNKSGESECIHIDDTDSEDEKKKKQKVKHKKYHSAKLSAVIKLISNTQNKYLKKNAKLEKPSIDQLNRKITSIGRQIINKRGFNCTRVIKYMEHMNLNIIWLSRPPQHVTSSSNYFKIIPRLKYPNEKYINNFEGYKKKYDKPVEISKIENKTLVQESDVAEASVITGESTSVAVSGPIETSENLKQVASVKCFTIPTSLNASEKCKLNVLPDLAETRKLLNSSPVLNPRKLPKKGISDSKQAKCATSIPTSEIHYTNEHLEMISSVSEKNIQMPIITCTTSLAVPETEILSAETPNKESVDYNGSCTVNSVSDNPKPLPRIKVKSVTELMSKETLSRMLPAFESESLSVVPTQSQQNETQNVTAINVQEGLLHNAMPIINNVRSLGPRYNCEDYIILDTVELPNTKTSSPFKYFQMLLQVHNLLLVDTDAKLSTDFNTLIKFKVLYKQESKYQPVILCLSLFCANNMFCLKIKDRNEETINMAKISANWQWEILKIYRGEVVSKVISNAEKISPTVHENTNRFLCLLKSINLVAK